MITIDHTKEKEGMKLTIIDINCRVDTRYLLKADMIFLLDYCLIDIDRSRLKENRLIKEIKD
jgi:hypothetical protein